MRLHLPGHKNQIGSTNRNIHGRIGGRNLGAALELLERGTAHIHSAIKVTKGKIRVVQVEPETKLCNVLPVGESKLGIGQVGYD